MDFNKPVGRVLEDELMKPTDTDILTLSDKTDISIQKLLDIINGKDKISDITDKKLCHYFSLDRGYFLRLQEADNEKK